MESFDFGIKLSLYLLLAGLFLCVAYGIYNWNKDGEEETKEAQKWEKDERKINEDL